jgi:hypothetical protein
VTVSTGEEVAGEHARGLAAQKSREGCQNPGPSGCGSVVLVQETAEVVAALDGTAGR